MPSSDSTADTDDLFAQAAAAGEVAQGDTGADDPDAWFAAAATSAKPPPAAPPPTAAAPALDVKPFVMRALHASATVVAPTLEPIVSESALALLASQRSSNNAYARFVPGEEIAAARPWAFMAVDPRERARVEAVAQVHERNLVQDELQREMAQALHRERETAFESGRSDGAEAARVQAQSAHALELQALHAQHAQALAELMTQFQTTIGAHREAQAQAVLALSCDIARQVLRRELQVDAQSLLPVIHEALAMVDEDVQRIHVHLHPDDLAAAQAATAESPHYGRIVWTADAHIALGGCRIQYGGTTLDATVASRWQRVVATLGLTDEWDPAPPAGVQAPASLPGDAP